MNNVFHLSMGMSACLTCSPPWVVIIGCRENHPRDYLNGRMLIIH